MANVTEQLLRLSSLALPGGRAAPRRFGLDVLAFAMVAAALVYIAWGMGEMAAPIGELTQNPISLDPANLPEYALRTTLRMLIAVLISLVFALVYATLAAKSRKAEQIMIPFLDMLQSVPVLGYISFTVTGFIALFPGSMMGVECAAIFAIFTAQAWNMAFSLYQSLKTIPHEMDEAAFVFRLSGWQKFWRMEVPFAMPGLVWNTMMSMSAGWFFVVASEAIVVGNQQLMLPGMGSYIALAIQRQDLHAIYYAIATMALVILIYDQCLFRPLVSWSDKFRYEATASQETPRSWLRSLFNKSRVARALFTPIERFMRAVLYFPLLNRPPMAVPVWSERGTRFFDYAWYALLALLGFILVRHVLAFLSTGVAPGEILHVAGLACLTLLRVLVLIFLASLVWVPVGIMIGLNPRASEIAQPIAQFLAAFPANLLFPIAVFIISRYSLSPDIWLSPLMILGTQWYIVFNVIAGASAFPGDLRDAARNFRVGGWLWWRKVILPGIFPYFLTGAITASGGAWNASIVAEAVQWGDKSYMAAGLGAYIAQMTEKGDYHHIALGIGMMALFVVVFNRIFWRPLYNVAIKKLRFD